MLTFTNMTETPIGNSSAYHYQKIAEAIEYIRTHFRQQPDLKDVAEKVHLSPFHFQRIFSEWAGVSPKKFLQYTSLQYAKSLLKERQLSLFDTTCETGLSSTSSLHDLFVKIERMTPAEYQNGGENLSIQYDFSHGHFGKMIIASTNKGICHISFEEDENAAVQALNSRFPAATILNASNPLLREVGSFFQHHQVPNTAFRLHLKGTDFQLKVWEALLQIPLGNLTTYGQIALKINQPSASRAVGTAVGSNPVAFLIPCHRVIQSSGIIGGYMWGEIRKTALIGWESARTDSEDFRCK